MKYLLSILALLILTNCDSEPPIQVSKRFVLKSTETLSEDTVVDIYSDTDNNATCYVYRAAFLTRRNVDYATMSCVKNAVATSQ